MELNNVRYELSRVVV